MLQILLHQIQTLCICQGHMITECLRLEGISRGHLVLPTCSRLGQFSRTMSIWHLNISKDWDSTTSRQTVPVKQYFLTFRGFVPAVSSPASRQHWKEPGVLLLAPSHHVFIYSDENPMCLVFRLNSPSSLNFSSQDTCSSPYIKSIVFHWTLSSSSFTISLLITGQAEEELCVKFLEKM